MNQKLSFIRVLMLSVIAFLSVMWCLSCTSGRVMKHKEYATKANGNKKKIVAKYFPKSQSLKLSTHRFRLFKSIKDNISSVDKNNTNNYIRNYYTNKLNAYFNNTKKTKYNNKMAGFIEGFVDNTANIFYDNSISDDIAKIATVDGYNIILRYNSDNSYRVVLANQLNPIGEHELLKISNGQINSDSTSNIINKYYQQLIDIILLNPILNIKHIYLYNNNNASFSISLADRNTINVNFSTDSILYSKNKSLNSIIIRGTTTITEVYASGNVLSVQTRGKGGSTNGGNISAITDTNISIINGKYDVIDSGNASFMISYVPIIITITTTVSPVSNDTINFSINSGTLPGKPVILNNGFIINDANWTKKASTCTDTLYVPVQFSRIYYDSLFSGTPDTAFQGKLYLNNADSNKHWVDITIKRKKIAPAKFQIIGAVYSSPTTVKSDDPSLTQTYIRINIPLHETKGIDYDAPFNKRLIWFRNLFTQITMTTNSDFTHYVDSTNYLNGTVKYRQSISYNPLDSLHINRHVNRLDLLENANFNVNLMLPVITYVVPQYKHHKGDFAHIYFDPFCSLLSTKVNAPTSDTTGFNIYSLQYGLNLSMRTENLAFNSLPLFLELAAKIFWISPLSNSANTDLNFQYNKLDDYNHIIPGRHLMDKSNHPYYNFDALFIYNLNQKADNSSNVFVHFSFFTNIVSPTESNNGHVFNNYMQLQVGYAVDLQKFITAILPQNNSTSTTSSSNK